MGGWSDWTRVRPRDCRWPLSKLRLLRVELPSAHPPIRPSAPPSKLQALQVARARRDVFERLRRLIVLDNGMLDARLIPLRKDALPVDLPLPYVDHLMLRGTRGVLHVHERNAARPAGEIRERVLARLVYPVEIDLELDELGIGVLEQHVVGDLAFEFREFEIVVVIGELDPRVVRHLSGAVEDLGEVFPVV